MQYNSTLFGAKTPLYSDQAHSNYCFDCGSINISQQSGYTSTAFTMGQNLPDDLFYWQIPADSPYSARSYLTRRGSSGSYTYNKYDSEKGEENVPIVLVAGKPKRNAQYNFDPSGSFDGNVVMHAYGFNTVSESVLKENNNSNPLWYHTAQLPSTQPSQGYWNGYPWILDFDYNNVIVEILVSVNGGSAIMPLATYIENNNTAANKINWIGIQIYAGDKSTKASTKTRYIIRAAKYNEGGTQIINPGICVPILTDYHYTLPDYVKDSTNYSSDYYSTLRGFSSGNDSAMLFSGAVSTTSGSFYNSYLLEEDRWECAGGETSFTLIKHGTDGKYADTDFDYIRRLIAYLGFWFSDSDNVASVLLGENALEYDENEVPEGVYQAVIENGVTTGEFIPLKVARNNDQSKWGKDWREKDGYNGRTPGGRPRPTPDPHPIRPSSPSFTLAGKGTQCYALTSAEMEEIMTDIFGRSGASYKELVEGLAMFGSDPMGAILSYKWYPFAFSSTVTSPLYLGQTIVNESHVYPIINNTNTSLTQFHGSFWLGKDKDFVQSKKAQCRLYLPFYGFYEISMPLVLSQVLDIDFHYNVPDETAVWIISFGDVIYDYLECVPSIEIPLTGTNAAMIAQTKKNTVLQIATQVANMAASAFTGGAAIKVANAATNAVQSAGMATAAFGMDAGITSSAGYGFALGGIQGAASAGRGATGLGLAGMGASGLGAAGNVYNTYKQAQLNIANMRVNVPYHGAADATTFLNLEMRPYIQFYIPDMIDGYNEANYQLTVGHACDIWTTLNDMPNNSLCQTSGTADMNTANMEMTELQELNEILISGFYK